MLFGQCLLVRSNLPKPDKYCNCRIRLIDIPKTVNILNQRFLSIYQHKILGFNEALLHNPCRIYSYHKKRGSLCNERQCP